MKRKKIWGLLLPPWLYWMAMASALIIIGILVLAIGAYIIYKLYSLCTIIIPQNSPQQTNSVTEQFYYERQGAAFVQAGQLSQLVTPQTGFNLQYGVGSTDGLPWIVAGTNLPPNYTNFAGSSTIYIIENDTNCFDFVQQTGGELDRVTWTAADNWVTNTPLNVVIMSSTDMVNWVPIFTNSACMLDAVNDFTDTNTTSNQNFYKTTYY